MFAKLTGVVDTIAEDHAIIDCHGVGYLVYASTRTLEAARAGETAVFLIETQVGEDHIRLFGFRFAEEQRWFRILRQVQGVGARLALAILSILPPERLIEAIHAQDKASLARANGVGPKLAQRILTELRDKAAGVPPTTTGASAVVPSASEGGGMPGVQNDALSALVHLGYQPAVAYRAVVAAHGALGQDARLADVVKRALQEATRG